MQIQQRVERGVTVIALTGRLDAPSAPEAQRTFSQALDGAHAPRILLDLSGVEYMSSGGIRALIGLLKSVERKGGVLKLCGMTPFVEEVFDVSNLSRLFDIHPTREQALTAF